ncbi:MAG: response regulator [Candidatus Omnitrophica bacterium]|nr:response regulator [Candidatus Omnitrophota bacterium]
MGDKKRIILLIDDEVDLADAVAYQLKAKKNYAVLTAYNGVEGLEKLKEISPDLIILDINMPTMGGIEFYGKISDAQGKTRYPVLVLTARANLEGLFKAFNVDGFMTKPFELDALYKEIDIIMEKRYGVRAQEKKEGPKRPKRVLIVEDTKESLSTIAFAFLNAGYMVISARSALESIEKILADPPDLLLIKLGLPDFPGDLVIAKLKQMPKTMDVACLIYTPYHDRLNNLVTDVICQNIGIDKLIESDDPQVLLREVDALFKKAP